MLLRISLIVALIAGLAIAGLNFVMVKEKITVLINQRDSEKGQKEVAQKELSSTKKELEATQNDLKTTKETLVATQTERDAAVATAAAEVKKATDLSAKLATTVEERDTAKNELQRYTLTGQTPEQVLAFSKQLKAAQDALEVAVQEKNIIDRKRQKLATQLAILIGQDPKVELPVGLKGKVVVCDPKWDFVVLDFGEDAGAREYGELLVSRDGKLVAKLRIQSVEKGRCVANVMPGWKLGDVMEGDIVFPAS